jgi:hypothetical protein
MSYCKPVFKQYEEKELAEYVFVMENRFFGLMLTEMRGLAFDLATRNKISHNFSKTIKLAVVKQFFCLSSLHDKHNFNSDNIYNVDETGISTVPSKQIKVLGLSEKRQVGGLSSAETGVLVTAEIFMSASGNFMPMIFVFPLARENKELLDDAPPGSTAEYHFSGWM